MWHGMDKILFRYNIEERLIDIIKCGSKFNMFRNHIDLYAMDIIRYESDKYLDIVWIIHVLHHDGGKKIFR